VKAVFASPAAALLTIVPPSRVMWSAPPLAPLGQHAAPAAGTLLGRHGRGSRSAHGARRTVPGGLAVRLHARAAAQPTDAAGAGDEITRHLPVDPFPKIGRPSKLDQRAAGGPPADVAVEPRLRAPDGKLGLLPGAARCWASVQGRRPATGRAKRHRVEPDEEPKFRSVGDELQTDATFDHDIIDRMGEAFYDTVFVPAIASLTR
jgi:hypothetical protein